MAPHGFFGAALHTTVSSFTHHRRLIVYNEVFVSNLTAKPLLPKAKGNTMSHSQKRARIILFCLTIGILALGGLSGYSALEAKRKNLVRQTGIPRVVNHTNSLKVVSTSVTEGSFPDFKVSLVNQSSRSINGYVLSIGSLSITTDFASIGEVMEPGARRDESIPLSNFQNSASQSPTLEPELTIAAVTFAELSGEGDSRELKGLLERHRGLRDQIEILLPRLRGMKERSSSSSVVDELETVAAKLSNEVDHGRNFPSLAAGRRWISDRFRQQLRDSKGSTNIDDLITFYEQLLSRI